MKYAKKLSYEKQTSPIMKALVILALIATSAATGTVSYKYGALTATDRLQRMAVAYGCGSIEKNTLAFKWAEQTPVEIAAAALPAHLFKKNQQP
jgi:hypothetical protein